MKAYPHRNGDGNLPVFQVIVDSSPRFYEGKLNGIDPTRAIYKYWASISVVSH